MKNIKKAAVLYKIEKRRLGKNSLDIEFLIFLICFAYLHWGKLSVNQNKMANEISNPLLEECIDAIAYMDGLPKFKWHIYFLK